MLRTPLKRKTPLRKVRLTPRRKDAAPRKPIKTAAEVRHHGRVASLPCEACGSWPVEVHHVRHDGRKGITRNHRLVIALCPICHRTGQNAVHTIGSPQFDALYGFSQFRRAQELWEESSES